MPGNPQASATSSTPQETLLAKAQELRDLANAAQGEAQGLRQQATALDQKAAGYLQQAAQFQSGAGKV